MTDTPSARDAAQAASAEQPQAGQPTPPAAASEPQAGQNARTPDDYERIIAELRKENAAHRTRQNAAEKAQAEAEAAKLSDLEKANKRAADLEAQLNDRTRAYQERLIKAEIKSGASSLGIIDPDAAVRLLDWSGFEYDDEGIPTNVDKLLQGLIKDKPYLQGKPPAVTSGGAVNPGRAAAASANDLTWDLIKQMSPAEYNARRAEILPWMARNTPKR